MLSIKIDQASFVSDTQVIGVHRTFGQQALVLVDFTTKRCRVGDYLDLVEADSPTCARSGRLLFTANTLSQWHEPIAGLYSADPDGANLTPVYRIRFPRVCNDASVNGFALSPTEDRVLFDVINSDIGKDGLYLTYGKRGSARLIMPGGFSAAWSPNGSEIACCVRSWPGHPCRCNYDEYIILIPSGGGEPVFVCDGYDPKWSPDGTRLAYTDRTLGPRRARVGLIELNGLRKSLLTPEGAAAYCPQWLGPRDLCFSMNGSICSINLDFGIIRGLVEADEWPLFLQDISPGAEWLAYTDERYLAQQLPIITRSFVTNLQTGETIDFGADLMIDDEELERIAVGAKERFAVHAADPAINEYLSRVWKIATSAKRQS